MHKQAPEPPPLHRRRPRRGLLWLFGRNRPPTRPVLKSSLEGDDTSTKRSVTSRTLGSSQNSAPLPAYQVGVSSPPTSGSSTALHHKTSTTAFKSKPDKHPLVKTLASWDPPELFKAYPQAIKHARLRAPSAQVKEILQLYEEKKAASLEQDSQQNVALDDAKDEGDRKKREKTKGSKNSTSSIPSNNCWAEKIYVLATSGYLLEYKSDGPFDRLPEKIMALGRESAAFASDAIAGEHWVLQVSRIVNDDGIIPDQGPKSIFRKFRFGTVMRRSTSAFLLVFDSPEDMNSWLVAIRKTIEALGGRKYRPDVGTQRTNGESAQQLRERPSRRNFVKREPSRFGDQIRDASFEAMTDKTQWVKADNHEPSTITGRRPSMATHNSVDSPSVSNATLSSDQALLERLKETPRMSCVSAAKTWSTSRESSIEPSPARAPFCPEDLMPKPIDDNTNTPPMSRARSSTQQVFASIPITSQKHHGDESRASGLPDPISMTQSTADRASFPPPPNLSVPRFSKRYSCVTNLTLMSPPTAGSKANDYGSLPLTASDEHHKSFRHTKLQVDEKPQLSESVSQNPTSVISKPSDIYNSSRFLHYRNNSEDNSFRPKSDHIVSRRFSSLDDARDVSIHSFESAQSLFPHPPPTTALPAIPRPQLLPFSSENFLQDRKLTNGNAEINRTKRRPVSLQAHSDPTTRNKYRPPKIGLQHPSEMDEYSLSVPITTIPKPRRAPPPPPLLLVQAPEVRIRQTPTPKIRPLPSDSIPEFSSFADFPLFINLERSSLGALEGPWNTPCKGGL
ncbi:hypothetical protein MMC07_007165 [Pseudocyphellaria aurata]|nr:hypothetical protein [Pseudocyphellaria aurata]